MHPDLEDPPVYEGAFLPGVRKVRDLSLAMTVFSKGLRAAVSEESDITRANRKARRRRREAGANLFRDPMEVAYEEENEDEQLAWAEIRATFARQQMHAGSPYLFNLGTIRLWGLLEATVDDGVAHLIHTNERVRLADAFKKLSVPFLEFSDADALERSQVVSRALKDAVGASKQNGIDRFESLLRAIGLAGPYDNEVEKAAKELSGFRHVLVHRDGVIDDRLLRQCPWLKLAKGERVAIDGRAFRRLSQAAEWLLLEYERRLRAFDGRAEDSARVRSQIGLASVLRGVFTTAKNWPPKSKS